MAKLIPFSPGDAKEDDLMLVAEGKCDFQKFISTLTSLGESRPGASMTAMRLRHCSKIGMKDGEEDGRTGDGLLGFH